MNKQIEMVEEIKEILKKFTRGFDNEEPKRKIIEICRSISIDIIEKDGSGYCDTIINNIIRNTEILFSERKPELHEGIDKVKSNISEDCYRLKRTLSRLS